MKRMLFHLMLVILVVALAGCSMLPTSTLLPPEPTRSGSTGGSEGGTSTEAETSSGTDPFALISLGYAAGNVSAPARLPLKEIVHYDAYGNKDVSFLQKATKSGPLSVLGKIMRVFLNIR